MAPPTSTISPLSLHDALPIYPVTFEPPHENWDGPPPPYPPGGDPSSYPPLLPPPEREVPGRSEEHTSELQSRPHLVCRLLLEKKNKHTKNDAQRPNKINITSP